MRLEQARADAFADPGRLDPQIVEHRNATLSRRNQRGPGDDLPVNLGDEDEMGGEEPGEVVAAGPLTHPREVVTPMRLRIDEDLVKPPGIGGVRRTDFQLPDER
jgi:hypothetical protein